MLLYWGLASSSFAWEAKSGAICILDHQEPIAEVRLTYDPAIPEYSITVRRADSDWLAAPLFGITFDGSRGLSITTNRHDVDGPSVTVRDSGFGNVLNGLEFNDTATAVLGQQTVTVSLEGAAPEVQKFRACTTAPIA
ncbi:MAG: hypothetical protein AAFR45_09040 [Pseudomonadota bacterium]